MNLDMFLVRQIQASYNKALSMLNHTNIIPHSALAIGMSVAAESRPLSRTGSPRNEDPDRGLKQQGDQLRCYFRCAHRNTQGCLATKLVQRSDDDPTFFEITYRGRHTCNLACNVVLPKAPPGTNIEPQQLEENRTQQSLDLLVNFQRDLKVVTPDSEISDHRTYPSSMFDTETGNKSVFSSPSVVGKFSPLSSPNQSEMNNSTTVEYK